MFNLTTVLQTPNSPTDAERAGFRLDILDNLPGEVRPALNLLLGTISIERISGILLGRRAESVLAALWRPKVFDDLL